MAGKRVLVLGRFRGGVRQRDIRAQLKAQGHAPTRLVRRAEVVIAGTRCGARLDAAKQAGLTILDQDGMTALTSPAPTPAVKPQAKPAAAKAEPAASPAVKPAAPASRRAVPPPAPLATSAADAIRQLVSEPRDEPPWWMLGQLFKKVPANEHAALVDEIEETVCSWPAHLRSAHTEWLIALTRGEVDPRLRLVGRLYLSDVIKKHSLEEAAAVLDRCAEHLPNVRQLRINHFKGRSDWLKILTPARMAQFTELDFMCNEFGVKGLRTVLDAVDPSTITLMDLRANTLGAEGMKLIADAGMRSLKWLHLYGNSIKNKGLGHLTTCKALSGLTFLSAEYNYLNSSAGSQIAKATFAEGLTGLKVKYNNFFAQGGKALAKAKTLGNLRLLDISCNEIGDEALEAMAGSTGLGSLEELRLVGNGGHYPLITDDGLWALSEGDGMPKLGSLDLNLNQCTESGLGALLRSDKRTALHTLNINNNNIPCDKADVLMEANLPVKLRSLEIGFSSGRQQSFQKVLRKAAALEGLESLVISLPYKLKKKPAVTEALLTNPHLERIQSLEIREFRFSDKALQMLIDRSFPELRALKLNCPGFDDAKLARFMTAPWLQQLTKIVLYDYPDKPDYAPLKALFEDTATSCVAY